MTTTRIHPNLPGTSSLPTAAPQGPRSSPRGAVPGSSDAFTRTAPPAPLSARVSGFESADANITGTRHAHRRHDSDRRCGDKGDAKKSSGPTVYAESGMTTEELSTLLAELDDIDRSDKKHGDKALKALLEGDVSEAKRQIKKMFDGEGTRAEREAMFEKLSKVAKLLSMKSEDLLSSLAAGTPGAAPTRDTRVKEEAEELANLFAADSRDDGCDKPRRAKRKRDRERRRCRGKDDDMTLEGAVERLRSLSESASEKKLEEPKKELDDALSEMGR